MSGGPRPVFGEGFPADTGAVPLVSLDELAGIEREPRVEGSEAEDWMPVRISREVAATLFVRDKDGRRLTWDFGQPDADGFYTPTITTSEDDWFEARQQGRDRHELDVERLAIAIEQGFKGRWFEHDIVPGDLPYIADAIADAYGAAGPQVRGGG